MGGRKERGGVEGPGKVVDVVFVTRVESVPEESCRDSYVFGYLHTFLRSPCRHLLQSEK